MIRASLAVVGVLLIAGCGGSGSPTAGGPSASGGVADSTTPAATGSATPGAGAGGQAYEACAMLTDAEILETTGHAVVTRTPGHVSGIYPNGCTWTLEAGESAVEPEIVLGVISPGGSDYFDRYVAIDDFNLKPLAGVGDKAMSAEALGSITAVRGDTLVDIQYTHAFETTKALIERAFSHVSG